MSDTLTGMAEHRNLEVLLKVRWSEESAGVVFGGIHLHDNPQLLPGIFQLMVHVVSQIMAHPHAAAENGEMIEMIHDAALAAAGLRRWRSGQQATDDYAARI